MLKKWLGMALITPILTFIYIWVFNSHTIITYLNIFVLCSLIIFLGIFLILFVQEGIFDADDMVLRRLKYQNVIFEKEDLSLIHFSNPTTSITCFSWIIPLLLLIKIFYILL